MLLTREREARGWSKAELARRAGLHPTQVGQIESRRLRPYAVQLGRLAAVLEFPGSPAKLITKGLADD